MTNTRCTDKYLLNPITVTIVNRTSDSIAPNIADNEQPVLHPDNVL